MDFKLTYRFPTEVFSSKEAVCSADNAMQPLYGKLAAPSNPIMNGFRETRDSGATTNWDATPASYHGDANHTFGKIIYKKMYQQTIRTLFHGIGCSKQRYYLVLTLYCDFVKQCKNVYVKYLCLESHLITDFESTF